MEKLYLKSRTVDEDGFSIIFFIFEDDADLSESKIAQNKWKVPIISDESMHRPSWFVFSYL